MKLEHLILLIVLIFLIYKVVSSHEKYSLMPPPQIKCKKEKGCEMEIG